MAERARRNVVRVTRATTRPLLVLSTRLDKRETFFLERLPAAPSLLGPGRNGNGFGGAEVEEDPSGKSLAG